MIKRWLTTLSCAALLASAASGAFALPTANDVQAEVQKGNYTQAQTMMRQVVEARPDSARAHYTYAEILAHNARFADAAEQLRVAKQLDPAMKFTTPDKARSFEQLLEREQRPAPRVSPTPAEVNAPRSSAAPAVFPAQAPVERSSGIPVWVWVAIAAVVFFAWRMMRSRSMAPTPAAGPSFGSYGQPPVGPNPGYGPAGPGYGPGYAPPGGMMPQGRSGSGLLGTGLAAAGGVAAGMMAERFLEGRHGNVDPGTQYNEAGLGGGNFLGGSSDRDDAARQLEDRNIDFGSGNNDWSDGGSASDAGSFDTGSSGGGSDDW